MKDATEFVPMERAGGSESFANRKLIRPSLSRQENPQNHGSQNQDGQNPAGQHPVSQGQGYGGFRPNPGKKSPPAEVTHAENFYYQKQMQTRTPMVIVLQDDEEVRGCIEWYDRDCIKINRSNGTNLMIYKTGIKYMFKESEGSGK